MPRLSDKYIAGFLDSDGCVHLALKKDCRKPQLSVHFSQKRVRDKVIYLLRETLGGSLSEVPIQKGRYCSTRLTVSGKNARALLERINKFIVIKRYYANACLDVMQHEFTDPRELKAIMRDHRRQRSLPLPKHPTRKWLAGYFDGDGCLSANINTGARMRSARVIAHIACSNYDTEGIEIIQKVFGGRIHDMKGGDVKQYVLHLPASKAKEFLGFFSESLIVKYAQAKFILGCAAMGHYRDAAPIKAAMKQLKAHPHRLNEPELDVGTLLSTVRNLPEYKQDYSLFYRGQNGKIAGKHPTKRQSESA